MTQVTKTNGKSISPLAPQNFAEVVRLSEILAKTNFIPKAYQGRPGDIVAAILLGDELGLQPVQSCNDIAVINGRPSVWGDAALALATIHPSFESHSEVYDEKLQAYICSIKRKGHPMHIVTFSVEDAKKAGLWNKPGPWTQYPKRMLQMRARGFALRDKFSDAIKGLILAEEAQDLPKDVTPTSSDETKIYASTSDKLIDKLSTTSQEEPVISKIETAEIEPEVIVEPMPTLAEQLTILMSEKNIPIEVMQKWLKASGATKISEMGEDELEKCIKYVHDKY
jgi:hypothetical protein